MNLERVDQIWQNKRLKTEKKCHHAVSKITIIQAIYARSKNIQGKLPVCDK